jgi:hypothetical protein
VLKGNFIWHVPTCVITLTCNAACTELGILLICGIQLVCQCTFFAHVPCQSETICSSCVVFYCCNFLSDSEVLNGHGIGRKKLTINEKLNIQVVEQNPTVLQKEAAKSSA